MAGDIQVIYEIKAEVDNAVKNIATVNEKVKSIPKEAENASRGLANIGNSIVGALGKIMLIVEAFRQLTNAIKGAIEKERNLKQLEVALLGIGKSKEEIKAITEELDKFSVELSRLTAIDDDAIMGVVKLGIQMGMTAEQAKELTKLAAGISATFGMDLQTAFIQLNKQLTTGESSLTRYDANLKNLTKTAKDNTEIINYLVKTYGGMAEAQGKVDSLTKAQIAFNNILKSIAKIILPILDVVSDLATRLADTLAPAFEKVGEVVRGLEPAFKALMNILSQVLSFVINVATNITKVFQNLLENIGILETKNVEKLAKRQETLISEARRLIFQYSRKEVGESFIRALFTGSVGAESEFRKIISNLSPANANELLSKIVSLKSEYNEIGKKIKEINIDGERQVKINTTTLASIKAIKEEEEKTKTKQKDTLDLLKERLTALEKLVEFLKANNALTEENKKKIQEQVDSLLKTQLAVGDLKGSFGEIVDKLKTSKLTAEEWQAVLENVDLTRVVEDLDKVTEKLNESKDNSEELKRALEEIKKTISDVVRVLDALISGLEKIGAISSATASSLKTYISSIQELATGIMSGDTTSALVGSITLLSQVVYDITNIISFYNQQTKMAISNANQLKAELEEINRRLEDIKDKMRDIFTNEDMEIALDELTKALDEKFRKQLDIVNEYYRKQINETQSEIERLQKRLVTLNSELTAGGRGRNEFYLKKEIRETEEQIRRLQERLANLNQSILIVNKNLSEMTKQEREREAERVRASISSLQQQKGKLEDFLRWLQENQGQFSTGAFGINIVASREAWNIYAGIVNELERMGIITAKQRQLFLDNAGVTQDIKDIITIINNRVSDLNSAIANQRALLDTLTKYDEVRLQTVEDLAKNHDALVRLYDLQGQKEKAILQLQEKANFLQREINKAKANGINTVQLEIEYYKTINDITERQRKQQEEINKLINERINKLKQVVELGGLDVENYKDIQTITKILKESGLKGMDFLKTLKDIGVNISSEFLPKNLPDVASLLKEVLTNPVVSNSTTNQTNINQSNNVVNNINFNASWDMFNQLLNRFRNFFGGGRR